jgi:hypothetical protein
MLDTHDAPGVLCVLTAAFVAWRGSAASGCGLFPAGGLQMASRNACHMQVVAVDTQAVQRHRAVIVDCVKDADVSIRRAALMLLPGTDKGRVVLVCRQALRQKLGGLSQWASNVWVRRHAVVFGEGHLQGAVCPDREKCWHELCCAQRRLA